MWHILWIYGCMWACLHISQSHMDLKQSGIYLKNSKQWVLIWEFKDIYFSMLLDIFSFHKQFYLFILVFTTLKIYIPYIKRKNGHFLHFLSTNIVWPFLDFGMKCHSDMVLKGFVSLTHLLLYCSGSFRAHSFKTTEVFKWGLISMFFLLWYCSLAVCCVPNQSCYTFTERAKKCTNSKLLDLSGFDHDLNASASSALQ